jgi:hypothetical protein
MRKMFVLIALAACGTDAPTPEDVRTRITTDLGHVLRETEAAAEASGDAMPSGLAVTAIERILSSGAASGGLVPRITHLANVLAPLPTANRKPGDVDEITARLTTELFTDVNHLGDGLYTVPASLLCEAADTECAEHVEQAQLRVRVSEDNAALAFGVEVGAAADQPLRIVLAHESLGVTLDLDSATQAAAAIAPILGEEVPDAELSGQITGRIDVLGPANVRLGLTIDRALDIAIDELRITSAVANVLAIDLDGGSRSGAARIALGETRVQVPDEDGAIELDLPGITAVAMMIPNQPVHISHVGLGTRTTTLSVGGQRALAIDLNPDDGRAFAATISRGEGLETIDVMPRLDLRVALDRSVLGGEAPVFDVTRVLVEGSLRTDGQRIEVVGGQVAVTTDPAQYGFIATAGQCASAIEGEDVATGRLYEQWFAGSCN